MRQALASPRSTNGDKREWLEIPEMRSVHHRRMSEYSKHEARIRLDEYMETYGSTNRIFDPEYSNIRIRPNKNAVHWSHVGSYFQGARRHYRCAREAMLPSPGTPRRVEIQQQIRHMVIRVHRLRTIFRSET